MSGFLAALWLLGLFAAAPALRAGARYAFVDRLRDTLFLGVAIPFALGFVHLLYPAACWCALALCVAIAYWRRGSLGEAARTEIDRDHPPYVLIAALVAVAWPQLIRPLLDGDSLSYHLPNAAAWVQSHSLWSTATRYWWYPPASELFASGLYAVGNPFALPWSGFAALTLLGFRIAAWAREGYAPPLLADALAAATVTVYPLAIQGGTLQNDVWLAAFWLEALWALRSTTNSPVAARALAVTALIKPQGWLLSLVALVASRAPAKLWFAAGVPPLLWLLHDALLWSGATIAPASAAYEDALRSTILAHGAAGFVLLARVALQTSPFAAVAFCAALFGPAVARRQRSLGWSGLAAALLFFVLPFGYNTAVAQLATGASLRFAAPAIAVGALLLAPAACRIARLATVLLLASTAFGVTSVLMVFWNDGSTHVALAVAALAATLAATSHLWRVAWPYAIAVGVAMLAAVHLAARHPLDYYADALRVGTASPGIYRWIERERPAAIGGWGLRLGVVNVLSPTTRTLDLTDAGACAQAHRSGVLLAAVAENDRAHGVNAQRLATARACGRATFDDGIGVIASPAAR